MSKNRKNTINDDFSDLSKFSESLHDFESIDLKSDWEKIESQIDSLQSKPKTIKLNWFMKIAASLVFVLGISLLVANYMNLGVSEKQFVTEKSGNMVKELVLPDGSLVSLNKNSTLYYESNFDSDVRKTILQGEAFFEVKPNPNKPFVIETGAMTTQVLGTSFKLKNKDGEVSLNVVSGKVAFYESENEASKMILQKNEKAVFQAGALTKSKSVNPNLLSWKTGILTFENTPLNEVFKALKNHYAKNFKVQVKLKPESTLSTVFDNQRLKTVLDEIKLVTNLRFSVQGDTVLVY